MLCKYLPRLLICAALLTAGCANAGVSGQGGSGGGEKSGGGSVGFPFFTSLNMPESETPPTPTFTSAKYAN